MTNEENFRLTAIKYRLKQFNTQWVKGRTTTNMLPDYNFIPRTEADVGVFAGQASVDIPFLLSLVSRLSTELNVLKNSLPTEHPEQKG